jgi:hypothetical protein
VSEEKITSKLDKKPKVRGRTTDRVAPRGIQQRVKSDATRQRNLYAIRRDFEYQLAAVEAPGTPRETQTGETTEV